ncbi:MAG: septation protein SepH, partial [Nocardioidaceae bacterium]
WDAWRRDDGRWALTASYGAGQSRTEASFLYDAAGRYVVPDDDEARLLIGEPVPGQSDELGDDVIDMVSASTGDLTETSRALRAVPDAPISDHADADWMVTQVTERTVQVELPLDTVEPLADEPESASNTAKGSSKRKGRASVPTWDEIMFGSGGRD